MSFTTEVANKNFQLNIVTSVDGIFYSKYQVDADSGDLIGTGSLIDADNIGLVSKATINPISVDIRNVQTTIQSASLEILDVDEVFTIDMMNNSTQLMDKEIIMYVGFITGSFDFSDYLEISRTRIKTITRSSNTYKISSSEVVDYINKDMFTTSETLDGSITDSDTTITLNDATNFPTSGSAKIGDEFIQWSGKSANDLTGVSRADLSSTAAAHDDESEIFLVTPTGDINPITLMLQLMISPGGGGTYDVLSDGLGISQSLVDVATFESIRDTSFPSDEFRFYLYDIGNALKFLEQEIMKATNTRVFAKNGKISLGLLDQIDLTSSVTDLNEDSIIGTPTWRLNKDKLVNKVIVKWAWSEGLKKYSRTSVYTDTDSISTYGEQAPLELLFKGVQADIGGATIASDRATRLLARLSTPMAEIELNSHFDKVENNIADKVNVTHRYLPQSGGGLGLSEQMEILSKAVDFNTGSVKYKLQFTSYSGLRVGLIAPTEAIGSVTDQKTFTVADGSCYKAGYFLKLWNDSTKTYYADAANEIASISGNTITMVNDFTTTLTTSVWVKFADYDESSELQRATFAYVGYNGGFFDDGTKSYQIII